MVVDETSVESSAEDVVDAVEVALELMTAKGDGEISEISDIGLTCATHRAVAGSHSRYR